MRACGVSGEWPANACVYYVVGVWSAVVIVTLLFSLIAASVKVVVGFFEKVLSFLGINFLFSFGFGFACEDLGDAAEAAEHR